MIGILAVKTIMRVQVIAMLLLIVIVMLVVTIIEIPPIIVLVTKVESAMIVLPPT